MVYQTTKLLQIFDKNSCITPEFFGFFSGFKTLRFETNLFKGDRSNSRMLCNKNICMIPKCGKTPLLQSWS